MSLPILLMWLLISFNSGRSPQCEIINFVKFFKITVQCHPKPKYCFPMIETVSDGDYLILWFLDERVIFEYYQISNGQFSMSCLYSILKRFPKDFLHGISWILYKILWFLHGFLNDVSIFSDSGSWNKAT